MTLNVESMDADQLNRLIHIIQVIVDLGKSTKRTAFMLCMTTNRLQSLAAEHNIVLND